MRCKRILLLTLIFVTTSLPNLNLAAENTYFEGSSGQPQGGIIIRYPDAYELRMRKLGQNLSHHGWSTVLVPLPTRDVIAASPPRSQEWLDEMAINRGQRNLVLMAVGDSWDPTENIEAMRVESEWFQGLILIDVPGTIPFVEDFPVLDIATTRPPVAGYESRKIQARKARIQSAQSVSVVYSTRRPIRTGQIDHEDQLTRRIRGWLHKNLRGMEITELEP